MDRLASRIGWLALGLAGAVLLARVVALAWVADDAYITFRVVDNFVNGHGLRWNVDERVEVATHPLWLLLHVPVYALTGNAFLGTLALCILCSVGAVGLAAAAHPGRPWVTALCLVAPLALSSAFVDYATSGLENPLSFLLFATFGFLLVRRAEAPPGLAIGLAVGLALLNRLDTLLLYAPAFAWLLWLERRRVRWGALALGLSPVVAWQAFRLLYFGFLFPNTKYAKLDAGPEPAWYLERGLAYAVDLVRTDPVSALLAGAGVAAGLVGLGALRDPGSAAVRRAAVSLGILAYALYVVRVGGDFMTGRFWALPVFAGAWCLHGALVETRGTAVRVGVPVAFALAALLRPDAVERSALHDPGAGIGDERRFYAGSNALWKPGGGLRRHVLDHPWAQQGLELRAGARSQGVLSHGSVGMLGFYAGPGTRIIDRNALCDPLLARLSTRKRRAAWRVGHLTRPVPRGYPAARETGDTSRMQPDVARYYEKVRLVVAGALLDPERLRAIWGFAWSEYDALRERADRGARRRPGRGPDEQRAPPAGGS
jgi:arabinofuranosyltransferase